MDVGDAGLRKGLAEDSGGYSAASAAPERAAAPSVLSDPWLTECLLSAVPGPALLLDRGRAIRACNAKTLDRFEIESRQIVTRTLATLVGAALYESQLQSVLDAALSGEACSVELSLTRQFRTPAEIQFCCDPFRERDGLVSGVQVQLREVTDTRQLNDRFKTLLEASLQGIYVHRDWTPLFANDACAHIFGYGSALELFSSVDSIDELIVPREFERLKGYGRARMRGELVPEEYEFDAIRKDGTVITLHNHARVVHWDGAPAILGNCVDVTESKRAGALLETQRQVLESVATGTDIEATLSQLCLEVEALVTDSICSVMLLQGGFLRLAAGPSLSAELAAELAIVEPGFGRGSCATATLSGQIEAVADTLEDSRWSALRTAARRHGVRACWSIPIISSRGESLGTFAISQRRPVEAKRADIKVLVTASQLAAIALQRQHAEEALAQSEERFRDFADIAADWFWETNADLELSYLAGRYSEVLGVEAGELMGRSRRELFGMYLEPDPVFERRLRDLTTHKAFEEVEQHWITPAGEKKVLQLSGRPIFAADGTFGGYRGVGRDVTVAHTLSERLSHEVSHDALTGLVNRREFEQRMRRVLASARESGSVHALCYMDLDQFKVVNDTCGHVAGDELLRQLGEVLNKQVRKRDTLARLGGDEFGVLMEHCSIEEATRVANAQRKAIEEFRFLWEGKAFALGVSIGVVPIDSESASTINVLRAADTACYAAKDLGRNRIHLYTPDDAKLARRRGEIRWASRINQALENADLYLVHQPIQRLDDTGEFGHHYELLLRMRDEDGREVMPGSFLSAAERYNLSTRLDRWVITSAFEWLAERPEHLSQLDTCSVNLSGLSLGEEELLGLIRDYFESGRVPAEKICLEITETAAISNLSSAAHFIRSLKQLGCQFALDDFGSGLSSFAYLKNLPVDYLKIDGSFVRDIVSDEVDLAMVRSINELGHVLGKKTIAEFVESEAILTKLRELNVDFAQGYHLGAPRPLHGLA